MAIDRKKQHVAMAMREPDTFVIRMVYTDDKGQRTRRYVSPIRFVDQETLMALCLCREEPRSFLFDRIEEVQLIKAHEVLMPMTIEEL